SVKDSRPASACSVSTATLPGAFSEPAPTNDKGNKRPRMKRNLLASLLLLLPLTAQAKPVEGGGLSPDGKFEVQVDLPADQRQKNIASKGLGCCVFRSLDHASRWQNVAALVSFPEWMVQHGIEGGGFPSKVDKLIPQIAKDRGLPVPEYIQYEGKD